MKSASLMTLLVSSSALLMPSLGNSQQWSFQPRINAGVMKYEFRQENYFMAIPAVDSEGNHIGIFTNALGEVKRSDNLPYIGVGGTISYDRFFIDLYGLKTSNGEENNINQYNVNTLTLTNSFSINSIENLKANSDIEREDYSFSVGYNVFENLVIFAGYKKSKTKFDNKVTYYSRDGETIDIVGNYKSPPIKADGVIDVEGNGNLNIDLDQKGPFIGAAYGWNIMDKGVLSVNAALGTFDGTVKQQSKIDSFDDPSQPIINNNFKVKGDVVGLTTGINWRGNITDNLAYSLGLSGYNYNYKGKSGGGNFSESVLNFNAGLSYRF